MHVRALAQDDVPALEGLLRLAPEHNLFHLSALAEHGLGDVSGPPEQMWAIGAFRGEVLAGVVAGFRGTGSIYHTPGDDETLHELAEVVTEKGSGGKLSLLSGHASQIGPLLPLVQKVGVGHADHCHFRTLYPNDLVQPRQVKGFGVPRPATNDDMERLIDFYEIGFYSLAYLPTRAAWRSRLTEQLAFRTLFLMEDMSGKVASAALSSAEGGDAAMLGGVATLDQYRSRGLSALCVAALCEHLSQKGCQSISLFYLKDNLAAGRVYDKLGFQEAGEWLLVPLGLGASFKPLLALSGR